MRILNSLCLLLLCAAHLLAQPSPPSLVLTGVVHGNQNKTYLEVPFDVPAGVHRISVDFTYTGKDEKTTLDLGIADPQRFRGNSGGNKSHFTIAESDATPSYLPGPILPGRWKLLLSVPNIRPTQTAQYRAEIRFNSPVEDAGFTLQPLENGKRWYRGDLHMHTAHSDGSCPSQSGRRVPCPVFFTAQTAAQRRLDFIAITDHNATSQYEAMRELQPYFDKLLLIPGREITTFWGHFNVFGTTEPIDYRVIEGGRDVNAVLRDVKAQGAIASINHADAPGGEVCMGCRWEPRNPVEMRLITAIEVINGGRGILSSADVWDRAIAAGATVTAIGGSDNHDALAPSSAPNAIGKPTTVVEAQDLSVAAILDGIRHGRVFIDLTGSHDRLVDLTARIAGSSSPDATKMGGELHAPSGSQVDVTVELAHCPHSAVHILFDGQERPEHPALDSASGTETLRFSFRAQPGRHWVRAVVRYANQAVLLVSNPIYISVTSK